MSFFNHICTLSSVLAFIIAWIRYPVVLKSFRPFIYFLSFAFLNDLLSIYFIYRAHNNGVNSNIYVLVEFILIMWLFKNWKVQKRKFLIYIAIITVIVWMLDTLILNSITHFSSLYRIFYSFVIIFLSINQVNELIVNEPMNITRDSRFIICMAFIIFFAYKALLETFYLMEFKQSKSFYSVLFVILILLNLFINLVYALAALWMPTKQRFTLPYS